MALFVQMVVLCESIYIVAHVVVIHLYHAAVISNSLCNKYKKSTTKQVLILLHMAEERQCYTKNSIARLRDAMTLALNN